MPTRGLCPEAVAAGVDALQLKSVLDAASVEIAGACPGAENLDCNEWIRDRAGCGSYRTHRAEQ